MKPEQRIKNSIMNFLRGQANVKCWVNNTQGSPGKGGGFHVSPNSLRGVSDIIGWKQICVGICRQMLHNVVVLGKY